MKLSHPHTDQTIEVNEAHAERYLEQGWREATTDAPAGNASLADWQDFARAKGFKDSEIEGKTRADLRAALS